VPAGAAGLRLDQLLAGEATVGSRAAAGRLIEARVVRVDGVVRSKSHRLAGGEHVSFEAPEAALPVEVEGPPREVAIAFEDEHLLVVEKPAGVVVHPGAGRTTGTLVASLVGRGAAGGAEERPGIVHRLDRDTSGLLVVAKGEEAHRRLQRLVKRRAIEREYLALVKGRPRSWKGTIDAPIGRDRRDPTRRSLDTEKPRGAVTHFGVERLLDGFALLRVRLETGRTHQIRVHLAAAGLPVVGDRTYGVQGLGLDRQFLHACRLAFAHPFTGETIAVESPLPADLAKALEVASGP
jgi:23S rRNA pseudouridine1911/1915/1917 synthase